MRGHIVWVMLVALWVGYLVWDDTLSGRARPAEALATAEYHAPDAAAPLAVGEVIDLATCQATQRRLAEAQDRGRVTLDCKGPL